MQLNRRRRGQKCMSDRRPDAAGGRRPDQQQLADRLHVRRLWNGRRFRTFNSIDDFSREAWRSRSTATARHARHRTPERIAPGAATTKPRLDIELTAKSSVVSRRARPRPRPPRTGFFDCPLLSKDARGSPRSRRSPDVTMVNTRSGGRPRQARARRVSSAERAVNLQFSLALIYGESTMCGYRSYRPA